MNLAIIGAGEMALELYDLILSCEEKDKYDKIFCVDIKDNGENVISEKEFFKTDKTESRILIGVGEPYMRQKLHLKYKDYIMTTFIHPKACVSFNAIIEPGSIILPFVYVARNALIGQNSLIHSGSKIENDCTIGKDCFIGGNTYIGAKTKIEDSCFIGPNSVLRDGLTIGENSIIGMGSVVTKSFEKSLVCYGNPAVKVRKNTTNKVF